MRRSLACTVALLGLFALPAASAGAQAAVRPELEWRTIQTRYFDIHYPAEAERWAMSVAERLDAVRDSVGVLVGYAPDARVTVMVEDPSNSSNGFAIPFLRRPVMMLWPTPVAAPHVLANNRGWGDVLAVHEYAHIAHLTRPSRNSFQRLLWSMLPVELGPVTRRSPRWVFEGYATYVEGMLTGSGRPNAAWRAAILRQWALEGRLPSYAQLNGSEQFQGGAMAYLAGSAFLEWLDARARSQPEVFGTVEPGESLVRLWRRMSARRDRGFEEAFRGAFGDTPQAAYGRFVAELTGSALAVRDTLAASGAHNGSLVQRLQYGTGAPAVSPRGDRLALVRRDRDRPARLEVMDIGPGADSAAERRWAEATRRLLERDPEDVPAVRTAPLPREALATLFASDGRAADNPRFTPDGRFILFSRLEPFGSGALRADLSLWEWETGRVRRVTHGAGVREADPAPDGTSAAGVACVWGICDLVRIDLASGMVTRLLPGEHDVQYAGPRVGPDGTIAVAEQRDGAWRILLVDGAGNARPVGPSDGASRYAPSFTPDGAALVVTSERGGIPHLERIDLSTGAAAALVRSTGADFSADVATDGRLFFLSLHPGGHDLRLTNVDSLLSPGRFGRPFGIAFGAPTAALVPAVAPAFGSSVEFDAAPVRPRSYRAIPGMPAVFPAGGYAADGGYLALALSMSDPVGRLGLLLEGGGGDRSSWRGGGVSAAWRRLPVHLAASAAIARSEPSLHSRPAPSSGLLDAELRAVTGSATWSRIRGMDGVALQVGGSGGRLNLLRSGTSADRLLGFAEARLTTTIARDTRSFSQRFAMLGSAGRTGDASWTRATASARLDAGVRSLGLGAEITAGTASADTPAWELFAVGGAPVPFIDAHAWSQRIALSGLPSGTLIGDRLLLWRIDARAGLPAGLKPFIASVSVDRGFDQWQRVAGLEMSGSFSRIPYLRLPNVEVGAGWTRKLTNPDKGRDTFHGGVRFRP